MGEMHGVNLAVVECLRSIAEVAIFDDLIAALASVFITADNRWQFLALASGVISGVVASGSGIVARGSCISGIS